MSPNPLDAPSLRCRLLDPTNDLVFKLLVTGPESHDVHYATGLHDTGVRNTVAAERHRARLAERERAR